MKKLLFLLIMLSMTGCADKQLNLKIDNVKELKFNDILILKEDSEEIVYEIDNLTFTSDSKIDKINADKLTIYTKDEILTFYFTNDYIFFEKDKKIYYAKNSDILNTLENLYTKYKDISFYEIDYVDNYIEYTGNNIKLDNTSKAIIVNFESEVYDFKINKLEYINEIIEETNLLYSIEKIGSLVIIRTDIPLDKPNIKICFKTKYNLEINIIPNFNEDKELIFETSTE